MANRDFCTASNARTFVLRLHHRTCTVRVQCIQCKTKTETTTDLWSNVEEENVTLMLILCAELWTVSAPNALHCTAHKVLYVYRVLSTRNIDWLDWCHFHLCRCCCWCLGFDLIRSHRSRLLHATPLHSIQYIPSVNVRRAPLWVLFSLG